jgi:hypothetical protein
MMAVSRAASFFGMSSFSQTGLALKIWVRERSVRLNVALRSPAARAEEMQKKHRPLK